MNGENYSQLMDEDVLPMLKTRYKSKFIYQQDNTRPHTCKKVENIFNKQKIRILKWSPHTLDLSIIENIWHIMKVPVYGGQIFLNKNDLWEKNIKYISIRKSLRK